MSPYFDNLNDFIAMGGHGRYVWASYGLTLLAIIGLMVQSRAQRRRIQRDILNQHARQTSRRQHRNTAPITAAKPPPDPAQQ